MPRRIKRRPIVRQISTKRPIDKAIVIGTIISDLAAKKVDLFGPMTFPGTWSGFRWQVGGSSSANPATYNFISWAIIKTRDGVAPLFPTVVPTLSTATAAPTFIMPEQDVIAFGILPVTSLSATQNQIMEGSTKSMRKMNKGDQIFFVCSFGGTLSGTGAQGACSFVVQAFYKT